MTQTQNHKYKFTHTHKYNCIHKYHTQIQKQQTNANMQPSSALSRTRPLLDDPVACCKDFFRHFPQLFLKKAKQCLLFFCTGKLDTCMRVNISFWKVMFARLGRLQQVKIVALDHLCIFAKGLQCNLFVFLRDLHALQ